MADLETITWGEHCGIDMETGMANYSFKRITTNPSLGFRDNPDIQIFNAFKGGQIVGYETNIDSFIGEGRSMVNPIAVEKGVCTSQYKSNADSCSVMQIDVVLNPSEIRDFFVFLGVESYKNESANIVELYGNTETVRSELGFLENNKKSITNAIRIF